MFESTIPFIHYYTNQIPVADLASNSGVSQILNTLRFFGLPESILSSIRGLLHDSGALIIAIIFFFLPFNLSKIGALIISLLLPAYKSSLVIVEMRTASEKKSSSSSASNPSEGNQSTLTKSFHLLTSYLPFMKSSSQEKQQPPPPINKIQFWLEYWMCLATLSLLQIYGIAKFWPTSLMILTLWLQNSHFHGASLVFQWSGKFINELVNYEKTRSKTVTTPAAPVVTENGTTDTSPSPPEEITQRTLPSDSQEEIIRSNSNPHVDFQEKDSNSEIMNTSTTPLVVAVSSRKYDEEEEVQDSPSPQITNQSQQIEIESTNTLNSSGRMTSDEPVS